MDSVATYKEIVRNSKIGDPKYFLGSVKAYDFNWPVDGLKELIDNFYPHIHGSYEYNKKKRDIVELIKQDLIKHGELKPRKKKTMNETLNKLIVEEIKNLSKTLIKESQTLEEFKENISEGYDLNDFEGIEEYADFYPFVNKAASQLGFKKPMLFLDSNSSIDYFTDEIDKNKKPLTHKEFENFDVDYAVYEVHGMKVLYMDVTATARGFFDVKQVMIDMDALKKMNIQESNFIAEECNNILKEFTIVQNERNEKFLNTLDNAIKNKNWNSIQNFIDKNQGSQINIERWEELCQILLDELKKHR